MNGPKPDNAAGALVSTLHVGLGERAYPIRIGRELLPRAGELLDVRAGSRAVTWTFQWSDAK